MAEGGTAIALPFNSDRLRWPVRALVVVFAGLNLLRISCASLVQANGLGWPFQPPANASIAPVSWRTEVNTLRHAGLALELAALIIILAAHRQPQASQHQRALATSRAPA
jgi:hypothetical protein